MIEDPEFEAERALARDVTCEHCTTTIVRGTRVTAQAHRYYGTVIVCPFCERGTEIDEDVWPWLFQREPTRVINPLAQRESVAAFMQRTDPVAYNHCREAGRIV